MPKSYRHTRAAQRTAPQAPLANDYEITDPSHKPDLRGEFAGAKVKTVAGKQVVRLTAAQARFYLDQGAIKPLASSPQAPQKHLRKA